MKVFHDGYEYWIEFRYGFIYISGIGQRETTYCIIINATDHAFWSTHLAPMDYPVAATATVTRYYKDQPNKENARKAALTKVLRVLIRAADHQDQGKSIRKLFWDAYLNRKKVVQHG